MNWLLAPGRAGWLVVVGAAVAVGVSLEPAGLPPDTGGGQRSMDSLPECQHDMGVFIEQQPGDSLLNPGSGELSLPGPTTNVPEFHDCQRLAFAAPDGPVYGPLAALFGAWDMATRWDSLTRRRVVRDTGMPILVESMAGPLAAESSLIDIPVPEVVITTQQAVSRGGWALVEIYAWERYAPLGIARGFNCAYFYVISGQPRAKMVNYGHKEKDCSLPIDPGAVPGRVLQVQMTASPAFQGSGAAQHYPPAARWHWDPKNGIQTFGVRCGAAWCAVGPEGFQSGALPGVPSGELPSPPTYPAWWRRVHLIPGWFDEQQLATPFDTNPTRPAQVWGRAFPDPLLDGLTLQDFSVQWRRAAWLSLDGPDVRYGEKLNVMPTTGTAWSGLTRVDLCSGTYNACRGFGPIRRWLRKVFGTKDPVCETDPGSQGTGNNWWARITSPAKVRYYCVRRRDHTAHLSGISETFTNVPAGYTIPLPGAVRWRWRTVDETLWMRCAEGCCEVEGPGG